MVKNADPILGARTIGAKQIYKCHEGNINMNIGVLYVNLGQ